MAGGGTILTHPMSSQPFLGNVLSDKDIAAYKRQHDESQPYTHLVLNPLCDRDQMIKVQTEAKNNLSANFKETDLFKVYQTGELGNPPFPFYLIHVLVAFNA